MENPATWNETQKLINKALCEIRITVKSQSEGEAVVAALEANNLIKPGVEVCNLAELVNKKFAACIEAMNRGMCGRSASGQVYSMLQDLGVVE